MTTTDEALVETVARAIEDQLTSEDGWEVGTPQLKKMCRDFARAAIAAMPPAPQWRTIDSAPRDGSRMLLARFVGHPAHGTALWWAVAGHWSNKWQNWNDGVEPCGLAGPTHWMPLPTPPAGAEQ